MTRRGVFAILLLLLPAGAVARAQGTTRDKLDSAKKLYENFEVERARPILTLIVSPTYLQPVSLQERVEAYKYLGASYALVDKPDSAISFFVAALDFDPFTELDPQVFSATELYTFSRAKERIFKVGIRPIEPKIVDPRQDSTAYNFRVVTTHAGNLKVELLNSDSSVKEILYQGRNVGERRIAWRGILPGTGQIAPPDIYQVRAIATDPAAAGQDVRDLQFLKVEYHTLALEDTLPAFGPADTLPTQFAARAPWFDLAKGALVGGLAGFALPRMASFDDNVKSWQMHALTAGGIAIGSGAISFLYRRQNRSIAENVQENQRRKAKRAEFNRWVDGNNKTKLDQRLLIITPASGFPR